MFQFTGLASPTLFIQVGIIEVRLYWVPPFGYPRIHARLQLPVAFRCLPRPSSPPGAKASTIRPSYLDLARESSILVSNEIFLLLFLPLCSFQRTRENRGANNPVRVQFVSDFTYPARMCRASLILATDFHFFIICVNLVAKFIKTRTAGLNRALSTIVSEVKGLMPEVGALVEIGFTDFFSLSFSNLSPPYSLERR